MSFTQRFTEGHQLLATIVAGTAGEHNSGYVNVGNAHRAFVLLHFLVAADVGDTVDLEIEEAQDAAGLGAQNIAGKAITQLTGADAEAVCLIELRQEELTPGYSFINAEAILAAGGEGAPVVSVTVWATIPRYPPVPVTLFTEIVP